VLVVTLAGSATRFDVPAGVTHVGSNARAGTPRFVLQRHGETIVDKAGEQAITDDDFSGGYNYFCKLSYGGTSRDIPGVSTLQRMPSERSTRQADEGGGQTGFNAISRGIVEKKNARNNPG